MNKEHDRHSSLMADKKRVLFEQKLAQEQEEREQKKKMVIKKPIKLQEKVNGLE